MTSNQFIELTLADNEEFMGCFHVKSLPYFVPCKFPVSFILLINHHWVVVKFLSNKTIFYFDSFGREIINENLICYLEQKNYRRIIHSKLKVQDFNSEQCGLFCICFIKFVHSRKDYKKFLFLFDKVETHRNDSIVNTLFSEI